MTRVQRRMAWRTAQLGLLLTTLVIIVDAFGWLEPLERYFYDLRARRCQYFTPPPSDRIYHMDIDDQSLAAIGRWPWPRATMARLIDELSGAGAKVIALDILYANPERPEFHQAEDGTISVTDHDALLAESVRRAKNVLVPVSVTFADNKPLPPIVAAMIDLLGANPELETSELIRALVEQRGFTRSAVEQAVRENFLFAAERGMYQRLERRAERAHDEPRRRERARPAELGGQRRAQRRAHLAGADLSDGGFGASCSRVRAAAAGGSAGPGCPANRSDDPAGFRCRDARWLRRFCADVRRERAVRSAGGGLSWKTSAAHGALGRVCGARRRSKRCEIHRRFGNDPGAGRADRRAAGGAALAALRHRRGDHEHSVVRARRLADDVRLPALHRAPTARFAQKRLENLPV